MRPAPTIFALTLLLASVPLLAGEASATHAAYSKRQLSDCMLKRMYSDRRLSYNDASKSCKDELRGNDTGAALSNTNTPKPVG
jgi:hypothetical protein